jgi:hypothetical protein
MTPSSTTTVAATKILRSTRDWHAWYGMITTQAIQLRIWDYLDPTKDTVLTEPERPQVPATLDNALTEINFKLEIEEYRDQKAKYLRADANLAIMRTYICNSVDSLHMQDLASRIVDPRELLQELQRRLCPTDNSRASELLHRYEALKKTTKSQDLEQWIYEWQEVVRDGIILKEIDETSAKRAFIRANSKINENLADSMRIWEKSATTPWSFDTLATNFLTEYREKASSFAKLTPASFVTTNIAATDTTTANATQKPDNKKKECLCGRMHRFKQCYYIIPSQRPSNWQPNEKVQKEVNEKIEKNEKLKSIIERMHKSAISSTSNNTSNYTATDSDAEVFTTLTTVLSTATSPLRNSFIADGASHIHVCNMKDRFTEIRPATGTLLVGDTTTAIEGYGDTYCWLTRPNGTRRKAILSNCAYVPNFHTNLVSTKQLHDKGMGLYELSLELQRSSSTGSSRECIAKVQRINRLFVIEHNPVGSFATGSNFPSPAPAGPSKSAAAKQSTATSAIWSQRLGHPSEQALNHLPRLAPNVKIIDHTSGAPPALNSAREAAIANQQISKEKTIKATAPFATIHWDIIPITPVAYNGDKYISHIYCEYTKIHLVATCHTKIDCASSLYIQ